MAQITGLSSDLRDLAHSRMRSACCSRVFFTVLHCVGDHLVERLLPAMCLSTCASVAPMWPVERTIEFEKVARGTDSHFFCLCACRVHSSWLLIKRARPVAILSIRRTNTLRRWRQIGTMAFWCYSRCFIQSNASPGRCSRAPTE